MSESKLKSSVNSMDKQEPTQISEYFTMLRSKMENFVNPIAKNEEKPQRVNKAMKLNKAETIMKDMIRGIDMIYAYCDLLDKVKDINLRRANKLEQIEINLFSREVDNVQEKSKSVKV